MRITCNVLNKKKKMKRMEKIKNKDMNMNRKTLHKYSSNHSNLSVNKLMTI